MLSLSAQATTNALLVAYAFANFVIYKPSTLIYYYIMTEKQRLAFIKKTVKRLDRQRKGLPARGRLAKAKPTVIEDYVDFAPKGASEDDIKEEFDFMTKYTADSLVDLSE